jgi:poly-gamma-glutamate synthesis protein (capsule biosynthesis protein)
MTVALGGDCMVTRAGLVGSDAASLRDILVGADVSVANLEVVPNGWVGHPAADPWGGLLVAAPFVLDELRGLGIDVMSCANNHALDLSVDGLRATIGELDRRGIPYAGIGESLTEARMPRYVDHGGGSVAVISATTSFRSGHDAGEPSPQVRGRPGVNPLRHVRTIEVTRSDLEALRSIDDATGLRAQRGELVELIGADPWQADPDAFSFLGGHFRVGDRPGVVTSCHPGDLDDHVRWVRDARRRSDVVVVSVHSHECGPTPDQPADFLREFAHAMIDAGAHIVACHGSHTLRGLEFHAGRPILYGLANLVSQHELVERLAADDIDKVTARGRITPAQYFSVRSEHGQRGVAAHRRYWQSIVVTVTVVDDAVTDVAVHPVSLGFGQPVHRRGRPKLATEAEAMDILRTVSTLSAEFDCKLELDDSSGPGPVARAVLPVSPDGGPE